MVEQVFNIALGRIAELYNRVDLNDPANAVFNILILATTGLETDAVLKDLDTVAALVAGTTNEVTNAGYVRKEIIDTDIVAFAPDDATDSVKLIIPNQTWTGVAAGDGWSYYVVAYDSDSTAGTDANIVPLTMHVLTATPDGSDITATIGANGFLEAS